MLAAGLGDGFIWLQTPFSEENLAKSKEVRGRRWDNSTKQSLYPMELRVCLELRALFGRGLRVTNSLADWAKQEIAYRKELEVLAQSNSASLRVVAQKYPKLLAAMDNRPYQLVGSAWLSKARTALLGDEPGLGKTLQAMGAMVEADIRGPILVFAPKTAAMLTWPHEIGKWLPGDQVTVLSHLTGQQRRVALSGYLDDARRAYGKGERSWLICNIEMVRVKVPKEKDSRGRPTKVALKDSKGQVVKIAQYPDLFVPKWQAVVVDESHKALITHTPQYWFQNQTRCGFTLLPVADGGLKFALSGTPLRGKVINLWGTLNWLDPETYSSYWDWAEKWFTIDSDEYGKSVVDLRETTQAQFYSELRSMVLRRTKGEVVADLPPKQYAGWTLDEQNPDSPPGIWLPMVGEQARIYKQMVDNASANIEGGTLMADGVLAEMTRLRQMANGCGYRETYFNKDGEEKYKYRFKLPSNKFDWLLEKLEELGIDPGIVGEKKVIVASQYTDFINMIARELRDRDIQCHVLTGETANARRMAQMNEFQAPGGPAVFLLNTWAGGVSLTLDAADDVIILDETFIPDDQEQVEDRAHRVSRMHSVTIHYVRSEGSFEQVIATTAGDRQMIQKQLLDGSRGVEYFRQLVGRLK